MSERHREYTRGDWVVVSLPLGDGKSYTVRYDGSDYFRRHYEIGAIDFAAALEICDCLAVNAC